MNSGPTLSMGSQGADVKCLQRLSVMMKGLGPDDIDGVFGQKAKNAVISFQQGSGLTADGQFGAKTESAVKAYRTDHGLAVDGIVGARTWWEPAGGAGATLASLSELVMV